MSKQHKIRWRDSDTAELQRVINNFNAKLYRLKKKNPDLADYLPERVTKSAVVKNIQTRADFNKIINSYKRFTKKGSETLVKSTRGAKATKWEIGEVIIKNRVDNARRKRERAKMQQKEELSRGKKTGNKIGSTKLNALNPRSLNFKNLSQKEWELKKTAIDRALDPLNSELTKHNFRLNYIKGLKNAGFSDDIEAMILKLPIDKFIEVTQTDTEADIDFIYDPIEFKLKQDALYDVWENALKGE